MIIKMMFVKLSDGKTMCVQHIHGYKIGDMYKTQWGPRPIVKIAYEDIGEYAIDMPEGC